MKEKDETKGNYKETSYIEREVVEGYDKKDPERITQIKRTSKFYKNRTIMNFLK